MAWIVGASWRQDQEKYQVTATWNDGTSAAWSYRDMVRAGQDDMDAFITRAEAARAEVEMEEEMTEDRVIAYIQDKLNGKYVLRVPEPPPLASIGNRLVI